MPRGQKSKSKTEGVYNGVYLQLLYNNALFLYVCGPSGDLLIYCDVENGHKTGINHSLKCLWNVKSIIMVAVSYYRSSRGYLIRNKHKDCKLLENLET